MNLDLTDIQGNILRAYAFPFARYVFLNFTNQQQGEEFLKAIIPHITNSEIWLEEKPSSTLNIGLSRTALTALNVPTASISSFPVEFLQGMAKRAGALGDVADSAPANWDSVWHNRVDLWVSINAQTAEDRETKFRLLEQLIEQTQGAEILASQNTQALTINGAPSNKEHFGYSDGIAQPDFEGSHANNTPGDGEIAGKGKWKDLKNGEFLLGYPNEAQEDGNLPIPMILAKNGCFMVYRKLEQNVKGFRDYIDEWGQRYPGGKEKLMAKFMGRWRDGTPLAVSPDKMDPDLVADQDRSNNFTYHDDMQGAKCPLGAHIRRANPRDTLLFNGKLPSRRRIIRRGMPYGDYVPESETVNTEERGIIFMALNSSISRQFEFVQQQWINYGNDFHLGESSDPVLGNRPTPGRFVIPGKDETNPPFICGDMKTFITLKGGDYFFLPSITALHQLSSGLIDPR